MHVNVGAGAEVHAELHAQSRGLPGDRHPRRPRRRHLLLDTRDRPAAPSKVQFADWTPVYERHSAIPNVARFYEQAQALSELLATAAPDAEQQRDLDFMLNVGHLFSLIVYGQLILEQAELTGLDDDIGRPDLRLPGPRLHRVRRCPARQVEFDCSPAGLGAGRGPQAGARRRPLRPGLGAGQGLRRRLRDAPLARQRTLTSALKVHASLAPPGQGWL